MNAADLLEKAAERIERDGLCQNGWYVSDDGTRYCAIGALAHEDGAAADTPGVNSTPAYFEAQQALMERVTPDYVSVPQWSDEQKDPAVVPALMREVAAELRAREVVTSDA